MKVLVCGSRTWTDINAIRKEISKFPEGTYIIHGGARGADIIAERVATELNFETTIFEPDWERGRLAGYVRNYKMLRENPDVVLAFWDGSSKGTKHMIDISRDAGAKVKVILPLATMEYNYD